MRSQSGSQTSFGISQSQVTGSNLSSSQTSLRQQHRFLSPNYPNIERLLSPAYLESELLPIDQVLHSQPGTSRSQNQHRSSINANQEHQLRISHSRDELDPMPNTPIGAEMLKELREWKIYEAQENSKISAGGQDVDDDENINDYLVT
ncbi:MAG: hypothetical protein EZS28_000885 [Streblomastix strix]|uniref:Uncharacterized protein n=1 Tax=Streblomastix strix TaxID=222440 RepID=A0A5J4X937_9EUKA|nr:MAG: hypothetical protein EZS28_000885 [Streblomastix strix]